MRLPVDDYLRFFDDCPRRIRTNTVTSAGVRPRTIRMSRTAPSRLALLPLGNVVVGIQPARGYNIDPSASYHDPDLPPPHGYLAFYAWLRRRIRRACRCVHMGKHGNLEWLPGKALALSDECFPEAALGPLPHIYPFIVNDPGEGSAGQAARRRGDRRPPDAAADARRDPTGRSPSSSGWSTSITRPPASIRAASPGCATRSSR